jgi:hypothetical protein
LPGERRAVILRRGHKNVMSDCPSSDQQRRRGATTLRVIAAVVIVALVAAIALVLRERRAYAAEIERLRSSMTEVERQRADAVVDGERHTLRLALELLRRQARLDAELHLSISVDSSRMYLERDGALLREMPVSIGAERQVGLPPDTVHLAVPRGVRTIVRVVGELDAWEVPAWVYADRGIPPDSGRSVRGALGPAALVLEGGAIVYSMPSAGPLNDSSYVLPGAIRARVEDLRAILPNATPGMRVFFY